MFVVEFVVEFVELAVILLLVTVIHEGHTTEDIGQYELLYTAVSLLHPHLFRNLTILF